MIDFSNPGDMHGLVTQQQRRVDQLLRDYNSRLSLRRIPESDPWFRPEEPYGVYEDGVQSDMMSPWVFRVAEGSIDERILAYVVEADFTRNGASAQRAKHEALAYAQQKAGAAVEQERLEQAEEEAVAIMSLLQRHGSIRHTFEGESVIIGDEGFRSPRTYIT